MNKTFRKSLILLAILLCSCESSQADHTENTSRMESSPASISVSATETATSETAAIYTPMTTEKSHPNQNARMETFENGDVVYQTYLDRLVGMRSNAGQVRIPYAVLSPINILNDKTQFKDTEKGWLGPKEVKMTSEELNKIMLEVEEKMKAQLIDDNIMAKANEEAKIVVAELLTATIQTVDPEFTVVVVF